jgi:hypothetical protein
MKNKPETNQFCCEFCSREFIRETTMMKHLCENKRRWQDKDMPGNRIGFQCWLTFYVKNMLAKKSRSYLDFTKSSYYLVFVKFGHYCININAINVNRYADWLIKNKIKIDSWSSDTNYTKFLLEYVKDEDPLDALARSIETTIELAKNENIPSKDLLRYGHPNKICYSIANGRISPWMLYQCNSGVEFLGKLNETQQRMRLDYINPEQWAAKFMRSADTVKQVKTLLKAVGY